MLTPINLEEAIDRLTKVFAETIRLDVEEVHILEATGRILYDHVYAEYDQPKANISAVDGYAVRSLDTIGASPYNPVELTVKYALRPGQNANQVYVESGTAVRVQTGAVIPSGADAVIMDEDAELRGGKLLVYRQVAEGSNIILRGEDIQRGGIVGYEGQVVGPAMIAALAASGVKSVKTYRKLRIALIAIGDELVEPGSGLVPGKEFNSSAYIVYSQLIKDWIYEPKYHGIVPDDPVLVEEAIMKEVERGADVIVTTGGTGVSEDDVVEQVMMKHKVVFRGVRMRPGRPTSCSVIGGKVVVHLSGFPVAAWTGYELLMRAAVRRWLDIKGFERPSVYARITRRLPNVVGYTTLIRVQVKNMDGEYYAEPYMLRGSGVISSLLKTDGYVVMPEDVEGYEKNTKVAVFLHTYW